MLTLVVARADNGVIGRDNALPWHIPADLRHFKRLTIGRPVVMGRRTFESIGKPLPGRQNIVLTRDAGWRPEGVTVAAGLAEAVAAAGLQHHARADEIAIIGGAQVYAAALPSARRVYLTEVHAAPAGETRLAEFGAAAWREVAREDHAAEGAVPAYSFVTLERA